MASLNTLRTKGGIIVSIVIGIALVAFLLGDFVPRGCSDTSVGSINGTKITYETYLDQSEISQVIVQSMTGKSSLSAEETDYARNMAWESLVFKNAYIPGLEKLGIWATEAEQVDMVNGVYMSPVIMGTFVNPQTGIFDPSRMRTYIESINQDRTGTSRIMWEYLKEQMNIERAMSKYVALVEKGMFVNDLDLKQSVALQNRSSDARILGREYSLVPDSVVKVSSSEIKDHYNKHKKRYTQEASREMEYVIFDVLPSDDDYLEADNYMDIIAGEFEEAANPMQYASLNSQVSPDNRYLKDTQIDPAIVASVFDKPEAMYRSERIADTYTLARQADIKMLPDSLGAKHILLNAGQNELADSLITVIRRGGDFGEIAREYSQEEYARISGGDLGVFPYEMMVEEFTEPLISARVGDIVKVETPFGLHIVELTYRSPLEKKAQIAVIKYKVDPSNATQQAVYADASRFINSAAGSYDNFNKASNEAALSKRVVRVWSADRSVSGLSDSREMVRWAFNHKKGQVSDIMEVGGHYVVAALTGVREKGNMKLEEVSNEIRLELIREKKREILMEQLQGSSLAALAESTGAEIKEVAGVNFVNTFDLLNIGRETRLVGAIAGTDKLNTLSKPVKGEGSVFVFEVSAIEELDNVTPENEKVRLEAVSVNYLTERITQSWTEITDIKDERVKYL